VAEQLLDGANVAARLHEVSGEGMAQHVRRHGLCDIRGAHRPLQGALEGLVVEALAVIGISAYNLGMSSQFDDLTKRIQALSAQEKAALVRVLIDDLDPGQDPEIEKLWIEEAERRYAQYLRGEVEAIPGDEVMAEARKRLK
jgi:putative addiction module component (TIGR02574 family)